MLWQSHLILGGASGLATTALVMSQNSGSATQAGVIVAGGLLGSMLPDIDTPNSKLGRMLWPFSLIISKILGHRGPTHSIIGMLILFTGLYYLDINYITRWPELYGPYPISLPTISLLGGYLSHILGDALTKEGVPILWPMKRKFKIPILNVRTGGFGESIWVVIIIMAMLAAAADHFKVMELIS